MKTKNKLPGNPCAELGEDGLIVGKGAQGTKKDVSCCMKKEKHESELQLLLYFNWVFCIWLHVYEYDEHVHVDEFGYT